MSTELTHYAGNPDAASYTKKVQSREPGLIVFVIDDSGSMSEGLSGGGDSKFKLVDRYVGEILRELLGRSTAMRGGTVTVKSRYFVSFLKYGSDVEFWPPGITAPMTIEDAVTRYTGAHHGLGLGGELGGTDAAQALEAAGEVVKAALRSDQFKDSFPPMVFHLTDGESQSDGTAAAAQLRGLASTDGNTLVVNGFIGATTNLRYAGPADFPGYMTSSEAGPDAYAVKLFEMSSRAPESIWNNLLQTDTFPRLRRGSALFFDARTKEMLKMVIQVVGSIGSEIPK